MASEQLDALIQGMRANAPDFSAPPLEVRAVFEALLATMPPPEGVEIVETSLGAIPALHCRTENQRMRGTLLYFHGGGYVAGSARGYQGLPASLASATGLDAYAIDYRLAPESVAPAAVLDGVEAYKGLLAQGIAPGSIVFAGDSAGGGLALAVLTLLRAEGIPLPAAGLLISPWVDLACEGASFATKVLDDPSLTPAGLRAAAGHYLGGSDPKDPLASPLYADLSGLPPLLIQVGSAEILLDDAVRAAGAAGAAGTSVRLEIWPEMIHVWHSFAFMLPEGAAAIAEAAAFFNAQLGED